MANFLKKVGFEFTKRIQPTFLYNSACLLTNYISILFLRKRNWSKYFCIAIFLLTFLHCGAQLSLVKNAQANQRYIVLFRLTNLGANNEKSKPVLDSVLEYAKKENDQFLGWEAYVVWAKHISGTTDSLTKKLSFFNAIWPQIKDCDNEEIKGFYYHELGRIYYLFHDFDNAFRYIVRATDIFERIGYNNLQLGALYTCDLFNFYYRFEDYPRAAKYSKLSVALNDTFPATLVSRLNDLGCTYLKMKDYTNAAATFKKVVEEGEKSEKVYVGIGSANYGNTLRLQGNFLAALPYLYNEFETAQKKAPEDCAITCLYIADCLLHLDSLPKAKTYIDLAPTFSPDYIFTDYNLHYVEVVAEYYQQTKQFEKASNYQQRLLLMKDSLKNLFSTQLLMATTLQAKEEKLLAEQQKGEQKATNIRLVRNVIIAVLLSVFFIVLYFINEKRKKERQHQQLLRHEAEQRLLLAQQKLEYYVNSIREKNAFIEKIELQLAATQPVLSDVSETQASLEQLHQSVILTEEDWTAFKLLYEQVWPGMFHQLNEKYPELSRSEERLLALSKLNISSKEMAGMIGISVDSLRKSRYRLRKKYPALADDADFRALL